MDETDAWQELLRRMMTVNASDLHAAPHQQIQLRRDGMLMAEDLIPTAALMEACACQMLSDAQRALLSVQDVDAAWNWEGRRFRGNFYRTQEGMALSLRLLPERIMTPDEVGMPSAVRTALEMRDGLVLLCGATGAGKTTTLAALIDAVNHTRSLHIITLEDPVEYVFAADRAFFSQREEGRDFASFPDAVRSALREDPDLLLVGEIRDRATIEATLLAAKHLFELMRPAALFGRPVVYSGHVDGCEPAQTHNGKCVEAVSYPHLQSTRGRPRRRRAAWRVSFRRMRGMRCAHSLPMSSAASLLSAFCRGGAAAVLPRLRRWLVPPPCEMSCGRDAMISLRRS
nr:ATPase, T2SS/T4P/T4SS family [Selenomonas felix]